MIKNKRVMPKKYFELEKEYSITKDLNEKLSIIKKMIKVLPQRDEFNKVRAHLTHKERIIKSKIKRVNDRLIRVESNNRFFNKDLFTIALIGSANSGKTFLLNKLCSSNFPSTITPFETKRVLISEMKHNNATIRVIEIPSAIKPVHARVLRECDLIILMPNSDSYLQFINDFSINTPVRVLKEQPSNEWGFLGLIVINLFGKPIIAFKGVSLSDFDINEALVNGVKKDSNYLLRDGDVIRKVLN